MEFRKFNIVGYWKYKFLDIHVCDIRRTSFSISFGAAVGGGRGGGGGAEPSLPEKKNELHWGAEQACFIAV